MNLSLPDSAKYVEAIADLGHLIKTWGAKEVTKDLRLFFPDQYEELIEALKHIDTEKKIARLLSADKS